MSDDKQWGELPEDVEISDAPDPEDVEAPDPDELRDYLAQVADEQGLGLSVDQQEAATDPEPGDIEPDEDSLDAPDPADESDDEDEEGVPV